MDKLTKLITESYNEKSTNLDQMSIREVLELMNEEDRLVPEAVQQVLPTVEKVVVVVKKALQNGGRLFYVGAGTSGRIGLLDSVECPPTFSSDPEQVQAVLAGGEKALMVAVEGAEDDMDLGERDLVQRRVNQRDVVIGIAASGRTPYVKGALKYAKKIGAVTVSLTSNRNSDISQYATYPIEVITGPEILTGSTRLKAATAHKLILNMISTASMVQVGKVYQNLMIDVNATNYKLKERAKNIVCEATGVSYEKATQVLDETGYVVKPAIVMLLGQVSYEKANKLLEESNGLVREAIKQSER
ncbi:N-acetylmuramic acid 6-phosphate etherase [Piscibacillus halophilus]|uniref:N-acetylmuramic acid 6-phosphate etherase n=1 Tax=Piscibacillus halophilus TaxID=571933 RepID=A0A1H9I1H0_9BACI|nr:N-acetylmuramic acid 6-phosphate etherase [Piscibacillus halophilus]SEQ68471.1 N-acetylmuramic acid 6-phosphate etherase [Piscibacillus halophilus]